MKKTYNYKEVESKIYSFWEKGKYFTPRLPAGEPEQSLKRKPFVITLPPPNVTGELHLGHAMYTVEDILTRYHRMRGEPTLWLPGFDHASIAVSSIINKQLAKEGKTRYDIGREAFLKKAENFAQNSKKRIKSQLKSLGFSLDWSREAYTMDKKRAEAVKRAFLKLYKEGLIYQGKRIVHWCPQCQTVLSDLENEYQEEKGKLYYIKYGPITIATTRPETMFADVAVAVSPKDKRYQNLIGKKVPLPLTDRQIPIIADSLVDPEFGTGALKITPAHDETDFEIGQKHKLPQITVIDKKGRLTDKTPFPGLSVLKAREETVKKLKKHGFLEKVEEFAHSVGHCQRCEGITEPLISKQWFVKVKPLAKEAIAVVKKGKIKIVPKHFTKVYLNWMENIHDWCISRQLWWGHKIPIKGEKDVLDTWFSSGLWPFSVFGWPEKTKDFNYFYPTTVRETGYDILFFWVAREIMLSLFLTGKIPYKTVYLHGLVRDEKGQKMSKTKGNILDPLKLTEKYGTDALRMALIYGTTPGNDLSLAEDKVRAMRNFANKIWNASRFVLENNRQGKKQKIKNREKNKDDKWILQELEKTITKVTHHINAFRLGQAAEITYDFFWHTFCDKYIEMTKSRRDKAQPTLLYVLDKSLKLLHPFMPFVTEEIWQLARKKGVEKSRGQKGQKNNFFKEKALIIAQWPK